MRRSLLAAAAAISLTMGTAGAASAATQLYNLSYFDTSAGFSGSSLGTITVTDFGTHVLQLDVLLNSNVWFQMGGNGASHDAFSFDLSGAPSVTYNFTTPAGGFFSSPSNGGQFTGVHITNGVLGQGFLPDMDYGLRTSDSSHPTNFFGNGSHLIFTVTSATSNLSIANLTSETGTAGGHSIANLFFGADLRQCLGGDPNGSCATGPVGAVMAAAAVPEPATWALMILGVGGIGGALRAKRRAALAFA